MPPVIELPEHVIKQSVADSAPANDVPLPGHFCGPLPSSQYDPSGHSSGSPPSVPPGQLTPASHILHVAFAVP